MSASIHSIPMASLIMESLYAPHLQGKRVRHRHLGAVGRLSGEYRFDRGTHWLEVETNEGRYFWAIQNMEQLGPVAMPAPRGGRAG